MNVWPSAILMRATLAETIHAWLCKAVHYLFLFFKANELLVTSSVLTSRCWRENRLIITQTGDFLDILDKISEFKLCLIVIDHRRLINDSCFLQYPFRSR